MRIRVRTQSPLVDVERSQPLELIGRGEVLLYHRACGGEGVVLEVEGEQVVMTCPRCRDEGSASSDESIRALRRLLEGSATRLWISSDLTLVWAEADD